MTVTLNTQQTCSSNMAIFEAVLAPCPDSEEASLEAYGQRGKKEALQGCNMDEARRSQKDWPVGRASIWSANGHMINFLLPRISDLLKEMEIVEPRFEDMIRDQFIKYDERGGNTLNILRRLVRKTLDEAEAVQDNDEYKMLGNIMAYLIVMEGVCNKVVSLLYYMIIKTKIKKHQIKNLKTKFNIKHIPKSFDDASREYFSKKIKCIGCYGFPEFRDDINTDIRNAIGHMTGKIDGKNFYLPEENEAVNIEDAFEKMATVALSARTAIMWYFDDRRVKN